MQNKLRLILPLAIIALICGLVITVTHEFTAEKIKDNARKFSLGIIESVITVPYDNDLYNDYMEVTEPGYLGSDKPVTIFRLRQNNQPHGIVLFPVKCKGYSGNIELTVGIAYDGTLMGVRVFKHTETEGLGDRIDSKKTDWILHFTDHSLDNTPLGDWAVTADGGKFDELSGATITSRGVVTAVRKSLEFYQANRDRLYQ